MKRVRIRAPTVQGERSLAVWQVSDSFTGSLSKRRAMLWNDSFQVAGMSYFAAEREWQWQRNSFIFDIGLDGSCRASVRSRLGGRNSFMFSWNMKHPGEGGCSRSIGNVSKRELEDI